MLWTCTQSIDWHVENHGNNQQFNKQSTKSQDLSTQHYDPPAYCICTCPKVWAAHLSMYACPKHVCTDHPVLVYKTCEIERTVPRLFSCLPLSQSPHKSSPPASTLRPFAFDQLPPHSSHCHCPLLVITVVSPNSCGVCQLQ